MDNNQFNFTYSAPEQDEIKKIRKKYLPETQTQTQLERLRQLDKSAETPGKIIALILGIAGTLLLGLGLCCTMVWKDYFVSGIIIGIIGIVILSFAYPVYKRVTQKRRQKIAPEILKLTEELEK